MKLVSAATIEKWESGTYVGHSRPVTRVTVQTTESVAVSYFDSRKHYPPSKIFWSAQLGSDRADWSPPLIPIELPNIRSVQWSRGVDTDVGSCTVTMWNNKPLDIGQLPYLGEFDQPGYYSPYRGETGYWPHQKNEWGRILLPDRILRVYQGYGFDPSLPPEKDPNMHLMGTFLIDDVAFSANQTIRITSRDIARLLLEHHVIDPTVPSESHPLSFYCVGEYYPADTIEASWKLVNSYRDNSAEPYMGGKNKPINGHYPAHSADGKSGTYWLSFGNGKPNAPYAYEWVEFAINRDVNGVRVNTKGHKTYVLYVSVYQDGKWQGGKTIPYNPSHPASFPNGSNIRYVKKIKMNSNDFKLVLPKKYLGAKRLRLTFTNLWNSGYRAPSSLLGGRYPYRAAVARVWTASNARKIAAGTPVPDSGNISDYSQIVAELAAYAGFWWPPNGNPATDNYKTYSDSTSVKLPPTRIPYDVSNNLGYGDIFGVVEPSYTCPQVPLGSEIFHGKTLMDGINYVKEILGFNFWTDDFGGVQFRQPNIFNPGNYIDTTFDDPANPYPFTIPWYLSADPTVDFPLNRTTVSEDQSLLSYEVTLTARNVREYIKVGNLDGSIAAVSRMGTPFDSTFRRVAQWTDQHFGSAAEAQVMADKIGQRILLQSMTTKMRIVAHPGIQIDDQIRVAESVTGEYSIHYVRSISSSWDSERGYWYYDLETNNLSAMGIAP